MPKVGAFSRNGKHASKPTRLDGRLLQLNKLLGMIKPVPEEWLEPTSERVPKLEMVALSSIKPRPMEWLWDKRIPLLRPTTFTGEGGVGKTFILVDIASRISRGEDYPDSTPCKRGRVLYFSIEDDVETVLHARFQAAGADMDRVIVQPVESPVLLNLGDKNGKGLDQLEKIVASYHKEVSLVVFDPITGFMLGRNINREDDVRAVFSPLAVISRKYGMAVANIIHFGKNTEVVAKYRSLGSVAFVNTAGAAWAIGKEYEEDKVFHFLQTKRNYSKEIPGMVYSIHEPVKDFPRVRWNGPSLLLPADLGKLKGREAISAPAARAQAKEWLLTLLGDGKKVLASDVWGQAEADRLCKKTVKFAKQELGVRTVKVGGPGTPWVWSLPSS